MTAVSGQFTRRIGLALELICMLGLLAVMRGKAEPWRRLGLDPSIVLSCGLGIGFCLWLWGTITIIRARKRPGGLD